MQEADMRSDNGQSTMNELRHTPVHGDVGDDTPLRLAVAAATAFPDGSMTASGLRRECARGRLVIERIAGKDYTTLRAIGRMRELCRVEARGRASGCEMPNTTDTASSAMRPFGLSRTANTAKARDAALMIADELRQHSPATSAASISPTRKRASVHPLKSP
jgi:hypothetical protein